MESGFSPRRGVRPDLGSWARAQDQGITTAVFPAGAQAQKHRLNTPSGSEKRLVLGRDRILGAHRTTEPLEASSPGASLQRAVNFLWEGLAWTKMSKQGPVPKPPCPPGDSWALDSLTPVSPPPYNPSLSSSRPSGGKAPSCRSGLHSSRLGLALRGWVTHSLGLP